MCVKSRIEFKQSRAFHNDVLCGSVMSEVSSLKKEKKIICKFETIINSGSSLQRFIFKETQSSHWNLSYENACPEKRFHAKIMYKNHHLQDCVIFHSLRECMLSNLS